MPLNLEDKTALVKEVAEIASSAQSVVAAEYRGITVSQMTELRAKARAQGVYMRVVKNTLARKALVGTSFEAVNTVSWAGGGSDSKACRASAPLSSSAWMRSRRRDSTAASQPGSTRMRCHRRGCSPSA